MKTWGVTNMTDNSITSLQNANEPRRAFIRKFLLGSAFAIPSVASFSMGAFAEIQASCVDIGKKCKSIKIEPNNDYSNQNLRGKVFKGRGTFNFAGANLSGATFIGTFVGSNFQDANLSKANLACSDFSCCDFTNANLNMANLNGATLIATNFTNANLNKADMSNITESKCVVYTNANMNGIKTDSPQVCSKLEE